MTVSQKLDRLWKAGDILEEVLDCAEEHEEHDLVEAMKAIANAIGTVYAGK